MANIARALLSAKGLVAELAPERKRVEFSPLEIRQTVKAGALLARQQESVQPWDSKSKSSHLQMNIYNVFDSNYFLKSRHLIGKYPDPFKSKPRLREDEINALAISFPNQGHLLKRVLLSFPSEGLLEGKNFGRQPKPDRASP